MEIAIIADDHKKELMVQFCIAYCGILCNHNLYGTNTTGNAVSEATGLHIELFLPGAYGGAEQILQRMMYNEIDLLLYFRDPTVNDEETDEISHNLLRSCDMYNIPVATNIATAEVLVRALDNGGLAWRDIVNPLSDYNRTKK